MKTAEGVSSPSRAATARPQGPAPIIITSWIEAGWGSVDILGLVKLLWI